MRSRYVLSRRARADLDEIWDYTVRRWDTTQAEQYIRGIQGVIETLAAAPRLGRVCNEIREGYFKYSVGSHLVFYRPIVSGIEVIRILHQRMDFKRHV